MDISNHFQCISLKYLWNKGTKPSKSGVKQMLANFKCRNEDVQHFLRELSINSELNTKLNTKTYFIMDKKLTKIYLYFTLRITSTSLIGIDSSLRDELTGDSRKSSVVTILLAQLGKNQVYKSNMINTKLIWDFIYETIESLEIRPAFIVADCKQEIKHYYERLNFVFIKKDNINDLYTYYKSYKYE